MVVKDHLGNTFMSVRDMYLHYGLNDSLYYKRKKSGNDIRGDFDDSKKTTE